jgi:hypothetical protein
MSHTTIRVPIAYLPAPPDSAPSFVPIVCGFIADRASTVGVFRESGNLSTVMRINETLAYLAPRLPDGATVHDVACFLKLWLRELPTPLLPPDGVSAAIAASGPAWPVELVRRLPPSVRKTLFCVLRVFKTVLANAGDNRMDYANLSVCFVPSFTQMNRGLGDVFPFESFYGALSDHITPDGVDFAFCAPPPARGGLTPVKPRIRRVSAAVTENTNGWIPPSKRQKSLEKQRPALRFDAGNAECV